MSELCAEVVLVDVREGAAAGAALDIQESAALFGFDTRVTGDTSMEIIAGADLVIVTAGLPRKPGMSRSDVLDANLEVVRQVIGHVRRLAPDAMLLMVTNPVDVLTHAAWRMLGVDRSRVVGLSGVLDAARMATFVSLETGFSTRDITAMVLGGHGDAMVPLPRYTTINGISVDHFLDRETIDRVVERTRQGGAEILALKKTSSAYDAPAAAIAEMVGAIARDRCQVLPCVAVLDGEYGLEDIAMGVPVILRREGVAGVVELRLSGDEEQQFRRSARAVRADLDRIAALPSSPSEEE